jgi:hypothetical protein
VDEPVDDLAGDLVDTLAVLIRRDLELAAARRGPEMRNAARELSAATISAAGLFLALAVVTFAIEQALVLVVRPWLAAAIVAGAWVCIAGLLIGFDLPWRIRRRLDALGRDAAARFARALASEVVQYERDELAHGAEHLRDTVEHETDVFLRELVSTLLAPGRRGIGLIESLADRGRSSR